MEKSNLSYGRILEQEIEEWKKFRRALRKEDQQVFDQLFEKTRLYAKAGGRASRPWPFETILISMLLEQEKALDELRSKIRNYEEREGRDDTRFVWVGSSLWRRDPVSVLLPLF